MCDVVYHCLSAVVEGEMGAERGGGGGSQDGGEEKRGVQGEG